MSLAEIDSTRGRAFPAFPAGSGEAETGRRGLYDWEIRHGQFEHGHDEGRTGEGEKEGAVQIIQLIGKIAASR